MCRLLHMIQNKRIAIVLPAYNAEHTLERTYKEIPFDIVDDVILVDDKSTDDTIEVAKKLGNSCKRYRPKQYGCIQIVDR